MISTSFQCGHCRVTKPTEAFMPSQRQNGKWCRDCFAAWHRERAGAPPGARPCEKCGKTIEHPDKHSQRFCCRRCKDLSYMARRKEERRATHPDRFCVTCGKDISERRTDVRFCSGRCSQKERTKGTTPEERRRERLVRERGTTVEQYDALLDSQNGCCAICGTDSPRTHHGFWQIDHDHACCPENHKRCGNCNRGLLCQRCNFGLGQFDDDPTRLRAAANYLEKYSRRKSETASTSVS